MDLLNRARDLSPWLEELYCQFHRIPELDRDLPKTLEALKARLEEIGVEYRPCAGGLLALLGADLPGPGIALRADMDALPVTEASGVAYCSEHPGKMHACGHDAHMTFALGALRLLKEESLAGPVAVLFQPAEETDGGAKAMIDAGALKAPQIGAALCLHVAPAYSVGEVAVKAGKSCAASDMFDLTLRGRGSHGAQPDQGVDTIAIGAQIVTALQQIVSRNTAPQDSAVVTVGRFDAGTARNVIPAETRIEGILRTLDAATREAHRRRIVAIATGIAEAMGAQAEISFVQGYPALINDDAMSALVQGCGAELLGAGAVKTQEPPTMGVDDFAYLCQAVPGCYVHLGCSAPQGQDRPALHSPKFRVDLNCLPLGAALEAFCMKTWLERRG